MIPCSNKFRKSYTLFPFLVLTRHISSFKPQHNPAIVSISTSIQAIVFQICVSVDIFFLNHLSISFSQNIFGKYWSKTLMAILKSAFLVSVSLALCNQGKLVKHIYFEEIKIWPKLVCVFLFITGQLDRGQFWFNYLLNPIAYYWYSVNINY